MVSNSHQPLPRRSAGGSREEAAAGASAPALQALVRELERLPGIGRKTAERLAYHVLRLPADEAMRLARAIRDVKENLHYCKTCFSITEREECPVCEDATRDPQTICVVEEPRDLYAIEATGSYRGRYHVLLGTFAPLDGVAPSDLTVDALLQRIRAGGVQEVILAMNPNFEGDGTALYLREKLKAFPGLKITRIARGVPSGSHLEHVSRAIVSDALEGRREMAD
jgi:recombination protein RecR